MSPKNRRPGKGDVIVLIMDGAPTRSWVSKQNPPRTSARKLKQKAVRIVGVGYSVENQEAKDLVKDISTPGEALETTLEDIAMIVDRVVHGFCPQPATGNIEIYQNHQ